MRICGRMQGLLSAYADGELPAELSAEVGAHIASCPDCARRLEAIRVLSVSLASLEEEPPEGMHERIMSAVHAEKPSGKLIPFRRPLRYGIAAAAAVAIVAAGVAAAVSGSGMKKDAAFTEAKMMVAADMTEEECVEACEEEPAAAAETVAGSEEANGMDGFVFDSAYLPDEAELRACLTPYLSETDAGKTAEQETMYYAYVVTVCGKVADESILPLPDEDYAENGTRYLRYYDPSEDVIALAAEAFAGSEFRIAEGECECGLLLCIECPSD